MKKYTIKEFAEGEKAVKIENEEQWNKLNKVHKLCGYYGAPRYYTNSNSHSYIDSDFFRINDWEVLEFSQLDFEDELVKGKWYKITNGTSRVIGKRHWYGKFQEINSAIIICSEYIDYDGILGENGKFGTIGQYTFTLLTDLSEIQQYLPPNHPDLIKKDTFVLPKYWRLKITPKNKAIVNEWKIKQKYNDDLFEYPEYTHVNSDGGGVISTDFEKENFITFEQFKTHVLKENTMEKEIVEYKLKFAEYIKAANAITGTSADYTKHGFIPESAAYKKLKEAGVLDLWFEPVYAPKFKVGDWVFVKYHNGNGVDFSGLVSQLYKNDPNNGATGKLYEESDICVKQRNGLLRINFSDIVRLATEEEIKKASISLPKINGKQCVDNGDKTITCGCTTKSFDWILGVFYAMDDYVNISDTKVTHKEIQKIVEYIKNK